MWLSPDGKIQKLVLSEGSWGTKPAEWSQCQVTISEGPEQLLLFNNCTLVLGDSDDDLRRALDICLWTMNEQECAKFKLVEDNITFVMKLDRFKCEGYIYQFPAKKKVEIAQRHKDRGVALFQESRCKDAAHRFAKGLKMLHSIPINAESPPVEIDGVKLEVLNKMKAVLYSNLASCYLKKSKWQLTIDTCKRVFDFDQNVVKAHYKLAIAYINEKNFEEAKKELEAVLAVEPQNAAALKHIKNVKEELQKAENRVNLIVKKMFS